MLARQQEPVPGECLQDDKHHLHPHPVILNASTIILNVVLSS